jgi:ATP-binding cassette, subfamily F, member 3
LSQHVFHTIGDERVIDVFRSEVSVNEGEARHILARFLFYGSAVFRKVNQLSGGERMRLRLAQLMYQDINLLILDEPTNHLDIDSCEVLEEALEQFNGTILAVSHDRYFLNKLFNKVYWLQDGTVYFFDGNYDWAKSKLSAVKVDQPIRAEKALLKKVEKPQTAAASVTLADIEQEIEELEVQIHLLKQRMETGLDLEMLQKQFTELERLETEREQLYKQLDDVV